MKRLLARFGAWLVGKFGDAPPASGEFHVYATIYRGDDGAAAREAARDPVSALRSATLYSRQGVTIRGVKPFPI